MIPITNNVQNLDVVPIASKAEVVVALFGQPLPELRAILGAAEYLRFHPLI